MARDEVRAPPDRMNIVDFDAVLRGIRVAPLTAVGTLNRIPAAAPAFLPEQPPRPISPP